MNTMTNITNASLPNPEAPVMALEQSANKSKNDAPGFETLRSPLSTHKWFTARGNSNWTSELTQHGIPEWDSPLAG